MSSKQIEDNREERVPTSLCVPKLRFPVFRDSDPWAVETFGEIYSFRPTNSLSREELSYDRGDIRNIHYGDIHTKFAPLFDIGREKVPFIDSAISLEKIHPDSFCLEGDMIFADASEDAEGVGKSIEIVNLGSERLLSGMHTILARQRDNRLIVGFGGQLFQSSAIRKQVIRISQGAKVLGISPSSLAKILICRPFDEEEQRKIADCLSAIDELISAESRKLDALKAHNRNLMQQIFAAEDETIPQQRFAKFQDARAWRSATIGEIFETSSGGTPDRSKREYWRGYIPWVSTALVNFCHIEKTQEFITDEGLKNSSAKMFPPGTILIAMYGQGKTRGKVAMLDIAASTNQACAAILPSEGIDPEFVFLSLSNRYDELRALSNSGGQENLSQTLIRGFRISIPWDIEEQMMISSCLSRLNKVIAEQEFRIASLTLHKAGLMQQLFPVMPAIEETLSK
jgi:type I restriction enzyme S subunit